MPDNSGQTELLLAAARSGELTALGQALEVCRNYLLLVAEKEMDPRLKAKGGASDLVQQTFLEAQKDFERFAGTSEQELLAWLRRLLLNNVANFRRHWVDTDKRRMDREIPLASNHPSRTGASWLADGGPTPSREMMADERDAAVHAAMARLPEDYQLVLKMRYLEDRPFEEIAAAMNRSANAVRKLWARAVEKLQEELDEPP
jgi:RNA polymerase sigma-70 factor (ECF subfamily)